MINKTVLKAVLSCLILAALATGTALAQSPMPGVTGYKVEWVYRVRYGYIDEWWDLWRKYEAVALDRAKELGYVLDYKIYHPVLHTDEAARWDYRVEITYKDYDSSVKSNTLYDELFPDKAARKRDEQRRWELTANHWDLPIYQVDPGKPR